MSKTIFDIQTTKNISKENSVKCNQNNNHIGIVHFNLTENQVLMCNSQSEILGNITAHSKSADEWLNMFFDSLTDISFNGEQPANLSITRTYLLECFSHGQCYIDGEARIKSASNVYTWISFKAIVALIPGTEKVKLTFLIDCINDKIVKREILDTIVSLEYEFVALINVTTGNLSVIQVKDDGEILLPWDDNYEAALHEIAPKMFFAKDVPIVLEDMSISHIIKRLETKDHYICTYSVISDDTILQKKWQYTWLDKEHTTIIYTRSDITDLYNAERDSVSGAYNREAFYRYAGKLLRENPKLSFAVIVFDIDRFKIYNDLFGLKEGDRLLADIGNIITKDIETNDYSIFGRFETDRFAMLIPYCKDDFENLILRRVQSLKQIRNNYDISIHIGVCIVSSPDEDIQTLCDHARIAQQKVKSYPDKIIMTYDDTMRTNIIKDQELERNLRIAFERDEFVPYFQPQYDHIKGEMVGAEALVRWESSCGTKYLPGDFIPMLEKIGLITKLDLTIFEKGCILLGNWQNEKIPVVPISINLSRHDLYLANLAETLSKIADKYGIKHSLLHLEITETAYTENLDQAVTAINKLRKAGFLIEMDDFGSGYSSLNSLKTLPVDVIKLDLKFLENNVDGRSGIILNSLVRMAHWLDLRVIAEGVETAKQADYLKTIDCRFVQGYFYSRPVPVSEYEKMLSEQKIGSAVKDMSISSFFNTKEFWNPDAQATVIFNTFVGAAGIFIYDGKKLTAERVNEAFFKEVNLPQDDFKKQENNLNRAHPDDLPLIYEELNATCETGEERVFECRWCRNTKGVFSVVWERIRCRCIAKSLSHYALYMSVENITQRKELEAKQQQLTDELNGVVSSVPCGIAIVDVESGRPVFTYISESYHTLLGYTTDSIANHLTEDITWQIHPDDVEMYRAFIDDAISNFDEHSCQYRCQRSDGQYIWVNLKVNPIKYGDSKWVYCCAFIDISAIM